ncbi:hypothetical protein AB833_14630 [Chromatiales bacterium (ex Bugula neritina AB1)]|nr:hypothetical protein AB833_14630 [Chromatiales bacterium (ex Bugula neritina AB1)]
MNSISTRLLLAAAIVLTLFIGITTVAILNNVDLRSEQARFERMQGQIYGLLGAATIAEDGTIDIISRDLPNPLMQQPMSGVYAEIRGPEVQQLWRSPSLASELPASGDGAIGEWIFTREETGTYGPLFITRFAVEWLLPSGELTAFQYIIGDSRKEFEASRATFSRNLWVTMVTMGALLLMSIALILAWGLSPLRRLSRQLNEIESGTRAELPANVPAELYPLTSRINTLIASERGRQKRYRQTLDDLAHSLKTPLSVLRNIDVSGGRPELRQQADRMDDIVSYHIKRADAGTQRLLTVPVSLSAPAERIINSLKKVYRQQNIRFENNLDTSITVPIETADLLEIYGNLLENACKYGATQVCLSSEIVEGHLHVYIDDNGPGFPKGMLKRLIRRGVRADTRHEGQGIGLALSHELVENYGGTLTLASSEGGGARVSITLPVNRQL